MTIPKPTYRTLLTALLTPFLMLGMGCAGGGEQGPVPLSRMHDAEAMSKTRVQAIRRTWDAVEAGEVEHQQAREMLKRVIWSRSTYWATRTEAIDVLMRDRDNLDDTQAMFALLVPTERVIEVLDRIGQISVERGWTNVAPSFVRAWDRNTQEVRIDDDRPEPRVLRELFPDQSLTTTLYEVFEGKYQDGPGVRFGEKDRRAAWGLLVRTASSDDEITALVNRADTANRNDDPLLWAVARSAERFRAVPKTAEQVEWVERLLTDPNNSAFVSDAERTIAQLSGEQRSGWQLRHISGVFWASRFAPDLLQSNRSELLSRLAQALDGREKFFRERIDTAWQGGESLDEWKDGMVWGDALLALIAAGAVEHAVFDLRAAHEDLFAQADEDHADTSTEYGGIVEWADGGSLRFLLFQPRANSRFGDERFVASTELIESSDTSLFHYHFHVRRTRNMDYAGPSFDDFEYARTYGRSCLLFTFVSPDRLNVDYFQPGGLRLDLGTVHRP